MTDPELLYAQLVQAFRQCRWHDAQKTLEALLPLAPRHAGVYGIAGVVSLELHQPNDAADYLAKATALDPSRPDFATLHAKALAADRRYEEAMAAADRALALAPTDPAAFDALGVVYTQAHAHVRAAAAFRQAVARAPSSAQYRFNLAVCLLATGDIAGAEAELERCVDADPCLWGAHWRLAGVRRHTASTCHVPRLQQLLSRHRNDPHGQIYLNMALAKELEDLGRYPAAFEHFSRAQSLARASRPYAIGRDMAMFSSLMQAFPSALPMPAPDDFDAPIFIVGMPRSGTTLVERILSSHPQVQAGGELQDFAIALQKAAGGGRPLLLDPDLAARTQRIDWQQLGTDYLASTRMFCSGGHRFTDKLPHNFLHAGFIAKALPRARIVCIRRDPMDTCLSNFRQLFEHASVHFDYSHDLLDIGRYYIQFARLMAHWRKVLPGRLLEIDYEALVDESEKNTRRLLEFCGLQWHDDCLSFEANPSPVPTLSAAQVRAPLNRASLGRWKHYDTQLAGLRNLLDEAGLLPAQ